MFGISPVLDVWCGEALDILYDYCFEPDSDYFRTLYAVVHSKESAKISGGEKYSISLLDNLSGRTINLCKLIIDCGFASCVEGEMLPTELPVIENNNLCNSDDEIEEIDNHSYNEHSNTLVEFDDSEDDEDGEFLSQWDVQVLNPFELLRGKEIDCAKILEKQAKKRETLPPLKALPMCEYRTPTVVWHQSDIHIKLTIHVPNVSDYIAKVLRDRIFVFRTNQDDVPYHLTLQLYGKVEKTFVHSAGGLVVKVTLSKCRKEEWPRLTINKNVKNVKYDMEKYQDDEMDEESGRKIFTMDKDLNERVLEEDGVEACEGSDFDENSASDGYISD